MIAENNEHIKTSFEMNREFSQQKIEKISAERILCDKNVLKSNEYRNVK